MTRNTLLASTLALLMAGSASLALAQNAPAAPSATPATTSATTTTATPAKMRHHGDRQGKRGGHGMREHGMHGMMGQQSGVIGNLRGLERLYMESGRSSELSALYNDVLTKSQNPRVRNYIYQRLARLQAKPANVDQSIATLRKGLDESLANDAKMRTDRETMRSQWQSRRAATAPVSIPPPAPASH